MIITQSVKVFKKNGKFKNVDIKDLSLKSHKLILVKCDICLNEKEIKYQDYNKITSNQSNLYYCSKCCKIKSDATKRKIYGENLQGIVNKQKETTIEKYGVDNVSKLDFIKEKKRNTCFKNYGVDIPSKSKIVMSRMKNTCFEKYGVEFSLQNKEIRDKIDKTILDTYGVKNLFQSSEIKSKIKKSLINKYGADHPMRCPEIFEKQMKSSFKTEKFEGLYYQGSYELDFILFCKSKKIDIERGPVIKYGEKSYYSDFYIKHMNLIVEIKSSYTFFKEYDNNKKKENACLNLGYNFLFLIDKDYTEFIEFMLI